MDTNIQYKVFEPIEGENPSDEFPVDENLLNGVTEEQRQLLREMMYTGHYQDGLDISRFLREDSTINLEKLELATILAVTSLEANSEDDATLNLRGLDKYYIIRNIAGDSKKEREERTFILGFVSAIASEASKRDTLVVKYVS